MIGDINEIINEQNIPHTGWHWSWWDNTSCCLVYGLLKNLTTIIFYGDSLRKQNNKRKKFRNGIRKTYRKSLYNKNCYLTLTKRSKGKRQCGNFQTSIKRWKKQRKQKRLNYGNLQCNSINYRNYFTNR